VPRRRRESWADAPEAKAIVKAACEADDRLTPERVRFVVDVVDRAEGLGWCTLAPGGRRANMARQLVLAGYLLDVKGDGLDGFWAAPGARAAALVEPFRCLPIFSGRKPAVAA
jgi:hypothetical protein